MSYPDEIPSVTYTSHTLYRVLAVVCLPVMGVLGAQAWRAPEPGTWLFLALSLFVWLHFLRLAATRVTLDGVGVSVERPGARRCTIAYRQIAGVHEEGRGLSSLLVLYHPRGPNGLIDPDELRSLALPALLRQAELLQRLHARTMR